MKRFPGVAVVLLMIGAAAIVYGKGATHGLFVPSSIEWSAAPNALPAGAKLAVLEGDPFKPGLYTMRLQMPAGYKIPPHWHKEVRARHGDLGDIQSRHGGEVRRVKGVLDAGGNVRFPLAGDEALRVRQRTDGDPASRRGAVGDRYVNPADDPRNSKKK